VLSLFTGSCQGELEDSVKLLVKVIRKASVVNSSLNFEVFLHKIDGIAEYERVDLLDSVSKLQKESFLEAEMGDINLRSVLLLFFGLQSVSGLLSRPGQHNCVEGLRRAYRVRIH